MKWVLKILVLPLFPFVVLGDYALFNRFGGDWRHMSLGTSAREILGAWWRW